MLACLRKQAEGNQTLADGSILADVLVSSLVLVLVAIEEEDWYQAGGAYGDVLDLLGIFDRIYVPLTVLRLRLLDIFCRNCDQVPEHLLLLCRG